MSRPSPSHKRHRPTADELSRAQKVRQLHTPPLTPERTQVVHLSMPRRLPTTTAAPVSSAALAAIDPELAHVPVAFVRQRVQAMAKSICDVLVTCAPKNALTNPLPRTIEIIARDPSVDPSMLPTHYLIVYNPRTPDQRGLLFPAHSLVLATQCAAVPRFGPTTRELREDNTFEVPLVGLPIPAPNAFNTLYLYLHTQNVNSLIASLLPLPAAALGTISIEHEGMPARLATALSDWLSMRALLSSLKMCHGVWANATALQVNDDRLWRFIHYAWAILIAAVERSSGQPAPPIDQIADDEEADAVDRALGDVAPVDAPPPYEA